MDASNDIHAARARERLLESMTEVPAYLGNGRLDILAANRLGYALSSEVFSELTR
jgi:transcription regulator MmyB-like protein